MKLLVALLDVKTETFMPPLAVVTRGEAERTYLEILRSGENLVAKHPHDFPLYEVGTYDERTGRLTPVLSETGIEMPPRLLCEAAQLLPQLVKEG